MAEGPVTDQAESPVPPLPPLGQAYGSGSRCWVLRVGLRAIIDGQPDLTVVGEAADGAEVPPLVARVRPDVVLVDVRMPDIDGHPGYPAPGGDHGPSTEGARPSPRSRTTTTCTRRSGRCAGVPAQAGAVDRPEVDVLRLMSSGLSSAEIAARLRLGVETAGTRIGNVLAKLGACDRTPGGHRRARVGFRHAVRVRLPPPGGGGSPGGGGGGVLAGEARLWPLVRGARRGHPRVLPAVLRSAERRDPAVAAGKDVRVGDVPGADSVPPA